VRGTPAWCLWVGSPVPSKSFSRANRHGTEASWEARFDAHQLQTRNTTLRDALSVTTYAVKYDAMKAINRWLWGNANHGSGATASLGRYEQMEQRRFFEVRGEESDEWLVLDGKRHPPRVICRCLGWNAPKNAALIAAALEAQLGALLKIQPRRFGAAQSGKAAIKLRANARSIKNLAFGATAESGPDYLVCRVYPDLGVLLFNRQRTGGGPYPSPR
jgi:hypothetical protein